MTNTTEYFLRNIPYLEDQTKVIEKQVYEEIKIARSKLDQIHSIELLFWTLCEAYREFLESKLLLASKWSMYSRDHEIDLNLARSTVGLKADMFTIAFRRYVDFVPCAIYKLTGQKSSQEAIKEIQRGFFDNHLEYNIFTALRNYAAHYLPSVQGITRASKRKRPGDIGEFSVTVNISLEVLAQFKDFKMTKYKAALNKLKNDGKKSFDLSAGARTVCSLAGKLQNSIRIEYKTVLESAQSTISSAVDLWKQDYGAEVGIAIEAVAIASGESASQEVVYLTLPDDLESARIRNLTSGIEYLDRVRICSQ